MTDFLGGPGRELHEIPVATAGWPLPGSVGAFVTTRVGGVSSGSYGLDGGRSGGLNLGLRCGDRSDTVAMNRSRLRPLLPADPVWLNQVHGAEVYEVGATTDGKRAVSLQEPTADAAVTAQRETVLAVLCADCLPVLFSDATGRRIGAAHAGWRGLAAGVLESTIAALRALPGDTDEWVAWLGPAIGPEAFEVGEDVLEAFRATDPGSIECFKRGERPGKWFADIFELARGRLRASGIRQIGGGGQCTVSLSAHYYSHRRDRISGRQAALIWIR